MEKSIVFLKDLFAPDAAFSRYTDGKCNGRFNRSIYEILTYYFSIKEVRIAVEKKKEEFVNKFVELNDNQEFVYAVSNTTKDINRVVIRFTKVSKILEDLLKDAEDNVSIPKFELIEGKIQVIKTE